ncbi:LuxR C-terminal-related transcriptional regulator [Atopomonas sediminilitoris]|uniref:LuxR C-terminal-related transcriptional regulator n=1 Tax=Atopomonas sediminilitoris TaxID=2919919 RepID=UPI001F4E6077|nr:LuxR C-terminal-related transcriptional regulator [Atopomonas sediminilitoris]MCJ8168566.1 LuxR C-terminal-related transcriptional regulator [Atopomonas sediminilitoris]
MNKKGHTLASENYTAGSLLRSRLTPPVVKAEYMRRPRLVAALEQHPDARVLLLAAPTGFGKSSALAAIAAFKQEQGSAIAWFALENEDDDAPTFWQMLIEAVRQTLPDFGHSALPFLDNTISVPIAALVESLILELHQLSTPLLLVVDDLHLLRDKATLEGLARLVQHAPAGFQLAIGSRELPPMPLATWRARHWMIEIGQDDLRLSPLETREYLVRQGGELNDKLLNQLAEKTEGWMVGVHLAGLWLGSEHAKGREITTLPERGRMADYLLASVFEQLPEDLQQAVLALSVATQINGDLANTLTGRSDGQALLEELEAKQLFLVPLDRERQWYRFHHLFADFARKRLLAKDAQFFRQLHFNASLWFTNHHMQNLAIEHACHADDPELLAALVNACGLELINRGQLNLLYRWRLKVPNEIAQNFPILVLADVWDQATNMALPEANRLLDQLLKRWGDGQEQPWSEEFLGVQAVRGVIALQKDDLMATINLARQVAKQMGRSNIFLEAAIVLCGGFAACMLGWIEQGQRLLQLAQQQVPLLKGNFLAMQMGNLHMFLELERGRLAQAQHQAEQLRSQYTPWFGAESKALALSVISQGLVAYEQLQLDGLNNRLCWALSNVDVINPIDLYARGSLCVARMQRLAGKDKDALQTLTQMQSTASRGQAWRFYSLALAEEVALLLNDSSADGVRKAEQRFKASDWQKMAERYKDAPFNPVLWAQGLTQLRIHQARGHFSEALHEITRLRGLLLPGWHGLQRLRLDLLAAVSYEALGYRDRAHNLLVQTLVQSEKEGLRSIFIEEGRAVHSMLKDLESSERQPALQTFIRGLLGFWVDEDEQVSAEDVQEMLTEREREVVVLAAQGMSNEQIGQQLALALGTVKWHLHNIYEKLHVRNRTQAIRRARELSLL